MSGISFFIEQFLGLVTGEIWDCSKEKIRTAYKNHKNAVEETKTFETRMYTAIVDAFCYYANINPKIARPDIMDFIYTTAEIYFNESHTEKADSTTALLHALNILDSKFGNTALIKKHENKNEEDKAKIETVANYLQKYIVKDEKFKDEYINEVLTRLLRMGERIEKMQLEQQLFPELVIAAVKESEQSINANINTTMAKESDRVISVVSNKIDSLAKERFPDPCTGQETKHEFEKPKFKDVKTEYADKWNERLFLHRRPEDEELTLRKTYISPLYETIIPESDRTDEPQDDFNEKLEQFINYGKSLLIIGPPGIGKTSIVCYLADKYKNDPDVIILRFSDWSSEEWTSYAYTYKTHDSILMNAITNKLGCSEKELRGKLVVLDGFDEIKYNYFKNDLLDDFLINIRIIKGLRIIFTSRENYILHDINKFQYVIQLKPFNESKIITFCKNINPNYRISKKYLFNIDMEVYGIPVILYMTIATGIDIIATNNKCSVYGKIFSAEGGIYDRFATKSLEGYDDFSIHDITYEKKAFINILCKTAFTMFRISNSNSINFKEYQKIIDDEDKNLKNKTALWYDFPIDNLYEKSDKVAFVHKSIYEYFVAENIYYQLLKLFQLPDSLIENEGLSIIADVLCANQFSNEIIDFIEYRIRNSELNSIEKFDKAKSLLYNLLDRGPTNFITNTGCENPSTIFTANFTAYGKFLCNINIIFRNLLILLHCWDQAKAYKGLPFDMSNSLLYKFTNDSNMWRAESISYDFIEYEFDPLANLIISYLRHLDNTSCIDLSQMGFLCIKEIDRYDFKAFYKNNTFLLAGIISVKEGFSSLILTNPNFSKSTLYGMDFCYSKIIEGFFENTVILSCTMDYAKFDKPHFDSATLINVKSKSSFFMKGGFLSTIIADCHFENCYFCQTEFFFIKCDKKNTFINCTFDNVVFAGIFDNCVFSNCYFKSIILHHINLFNSFIKADFKGSTFSDRCRLTGGVFTGADFRGADLDGAIYTHELDEAILE